MDSGYVQRRQHIMEFHLRLPAEKVNEETGSAEMRECFPRCSVYSDEQVSCHLVVFNLVLFKLSGTLVSEGIFK